MAPSLLVAPPAPAPAPPNCSRRRAASTAAAASNSCVVRCVNLFEPRQRSHSITSRLRRRLSAACVPLAQRSPRQLDACAARRGMGAAAAAAVSECAFAEERHPATNPTSEQHQGAAAPPWCAAPATDCQALASRPVVASSSRAHTAAKRSPLLHVCGPMTRRKVAGHGASRARCVRACASQAPPALSSVVVVSAPGILATPAELHLFQGACVTAPPAGRRARARRDVSTWRGVQTNYEGTREKDPNTARPHPPPRARRRQKPRPQRRQAPRADRATPSSAVSTSLRASTCSLAAGPLASSASATAQDGGDRAAALACWPGRRPPQAGGVHARRRCVSRVVLVLVLWAVARREERRSEVVLS